MNPKWLTIAAFLALGIMVGSRCNSGGDRLDYLTDWPAALAEARAEGKPILLNYGASW